jgi:Bacterial mobilisation protein (MobC)
MHEVEDTPATPATAAVERVVTSRRRAAEQRRTRRFVMMMSEEDRSRIKGVADARGVSIARLMQESALSESYDRRDRTVMINALDGANRLLANVAANINQLAHHANINQELGAHTELEAALAEVGDVRAELGEVLRRIK